MDFSIEIPTPTDNLVVTIPSGSSAIFVGANGGGKTRLAVHIENAVKDNAHRISAHRSLSLNPKVAKISEDLALGGLRFGQSAPQHQTLQNRQGGRWGGKSAVHLLNDYDFLVQALFADQSNVSLTAYHAIKLDAPNIALPFQTTKMDQLVEIWQRLLPRRLLKITGDDIKVTSATGGTAYDASEMSDGERAIFYMIGQALVASSDHLLIIDEPELHVHPSIMSKLWDELEAARPDCAFIYITHDLGFAAVRNAQKFVISDFTPMPNWVVEAVPEDTGFSEELTTLILGSRRPILFVEGTEASLDLPIYRACYPEWTVIPRSSCTEVIHSVNTMRHNASLTRMTCTGIVDGDDYAQCDKDRLRDLGIQVLSVCEVENLLLLPAVTASIAENEGHVGAAGDKKQAALAAAVFATLDEPQKIEKVVVEYCKRRIDRALKKVDLSSGRTIADLQHSYASATADIDISAISDQRTQEIEAAIAEKNLTKLLEYYDNKGLVAIAASHLKNQKRGAFKAWVIRSLMNETCPLLKETLSAALPTITLS